MNEPAMKELVEQRTHCRRAQAGTIVVPRSTGDAMPGNRPDRPFVRGGMGLDSIDILEVALAVSKAYASSCGPTTSSTARSSIRCAV